ncbi:MAG TPA: IPT/TIG domain-containing protein, partial [Ardenticatenaceae bacterium]|nr:IPT/TIG domain-containing protein [Ardenticatenaceae bacterium]
MRPRCLILAVSLLVLFSVSLPATRVAYGGPAGEPAAQGAAPSVTAVSPDEAHNFRPQVITISGANFAPLAVVKLGGYSLDDATFVDTGTMTATVPADLPAGRYDITLTNPDEQSSTLTDAFTVLRSRDGSLGKWEFVSPMIRARNGLALIHAGGFLYALGGENPDLGVARRTVERAAINPDGTLGAWEVLAARMTSGRRHFAAVHVDGYLYALGGSDHHGSTVSSVERAKVNADGTLGPWEAVASMRIARERLAAAASDGFIYALGGLVGGSSVERAAIQPDGSLGAWELVAGMTTSRDGLAAVAVGGQLYAFGGTGDRTVERAVIQPDGSLDPWQPLSSTNVARFGPGAVAAGGYLYAVGGSDFHSVTNVERAPINADGSLGPWELTASLTVPRRSLGVAAAGSYLYAAGGFGDWGLRSVERAEISPLVLTGTLPAALAPGDTGPVAFHGRNFLPEPEVRLEDDIPLAVSFVSTQTLSATLPATLARGWYTATLTNGDGREVTLANALLLNDPLSVESITPDVAANNIPMPVTIKGLNFLAHGLDVRIGNVPLQDVSVLDDTTIAAVVPPNRATGRYALTVSHRHAQQVVLPEAFTVLAGRDGSLSTWRATTPMELIRDAGGTAVAAHGWLYALGGQDHYGGLAEVERAPILADGSLGPWQPERAMTTARRGHAAVVAGGFLYVLGGDFSPEDDRSVERA